MWPTTELVCCEFYIRNFRIEIDLFLNSDSRVCCYEPFTIECKNEMNSRSILILEIIKILSHHD